MSTVTSTKRHALGLPAGSVRATQLLLVVGMVCAILLIPAQETVAIPPYLIYLLFLMLGHYFAHRASSDQDTDAPLHLPRGCIRFLVIVALGGTLGWCLYANPGKLEEQFIKSLDEMKNQPILPLCVLAAFGFGVIVRMLLGSERPVALQDLQAWLSILSAGGLTAAVVIHLIIMPSLERQISLPTWEMALAAVVAFYFGERS